MKSELVRNIPLYLVTRALHLPFVWLPILYFYLTQVKGFSPFETTFLLGLQELALIFLEVPTGVVADKISRRFSMILGYVITSLPFLLLPFTNSLVIVAILFIGKAIGKAFVSGADSALLYDTLNQLGRKNEYKRIKTYGGFLMMGVTTLAIFLGGWLGEGEMYSLALIIPFPLQLIAAVAAYLMIEPNLSDHGSQIQESNYLKHTWGAIKIVLASKWLLVLSVLFAILEGTAVNMKWYYPAIFDNFGYSLLATGTIMGILYGGKTMINLVGVKLLSKDAVVNVLVWTALIAFSWAFLGQVGTALGIVSLLILILLGLELATNSVEELIHDRLENRIRATAMSFINLLSSAGATALLWTWGGAIQLGGLSSALYIQAAVFGGGWIMMWIVSMKKQSYR